MIAQLLTQFEELGVKLETDGAELTIDAPKGVLTPELVKRLKENKQAIIDHLVSAPVAVPMTGMQQDVWMAIQLEPAVSQAYNMASGLQLDGPLQIPALEEALQKVVQRHEALRTVIDAGGELLHILPQLSVELPLVDLSALLPDEQAARLDEIKLAEVTKPFDLVNGPLFRTKLLKLGAEQHILLINVHHIVVDGWSLGVISQNLAAFYTAVCTNTTPELPPRVSLQRYNQDQALLDQKPAYQKAEAYWTNEFADTVPVLELPADRKRPSRRSFQAYQVNHTLDAALVAKIKQFAAEKNITFFSFMMTAYHTLLYRLSGQQNMVVGIPVAGQMQYVGRDLVGDCVNFLPIRLDFAGDMPFSQLLETAANEKLPLGITHQAYPFGALLKKLPIKRDLSRMPLISVAFNLFPSVPAPAFHKLTVSTTMLPHVTVLYDSFLDVMDTADGCELQLLANADLFDVETIERQIAGYEALLETAVANPDMPVNQLPILDDAAKQTLLVDWNDTEMVYDHTATLSQLIEAQVEKTPGKTAVFFKDSEISYAELNEQANRLAHYLQSLGVQPDQFVGLCMERTPQMLVGLLAVHKAGAAYLPMDPNYPAERLAYMLEDTQAPILITQADLVDALPAFTGKQILIDADWPLIAACTDQNPSSTATSDNLAYVIHTSGSTGKPKGVLITQRNVVNFLLTMANKPGITQDDRLLAVTTLSFDIAVLELFLPLISGASVLLADQEMTADGARLADAIMHYGVTMMQATPATWQMMLASGWEPPAALTMLSGGEALPRKLADQLLVGGGALWNMYGPTETTVWSSVWQVTHGSTILIGKPIGNTQMYVLDEQHNPVPVGVTGELWIAGDGVARGYLNRPEQTTERFKDLQLTIDDLRVDASFNGQSKIENRKYYKTGDLARYLPDGTIECLGRVDFQVKVRGFRIELGEIETVLETYPTVRSAVVNAADYGEDDKRLVAYLLLNAGEAVPETAVLRQHLQQKLPPYMIPAAYVVLDSFPLTPNGKVNRLALPDVETAVTTRAVQYTPPQTETELALAGIWIDLLKLPQVGLHDDFFELGGHSLLATQMIARLRSAYEIDFPLAAFFEAPNLSALARQVEAAIWSLQPESEEMMVEDELEEFEF